MEKSRWLARINDKSLSRWIKTFDGWCVLHNTVIIHWTYRAELTNDPSLGVNQKMNDSEAACCGA